MARIREISCFLLGVAILGCLFSLALSEVWELETRWFVIIIVGICAISISLCMVYAFSDFLLVVSLFCLPLASFAKWFWPIGYESRHGDIVFAGVFGVGLTDFILIGLYMAWVYRIFVVRQQLPPQLNKIDAFILWLILAHLVATIGSEDSILALSSTQFLTKNALFYFYLSRHLEEQHLPWLIIAFFFAIFLEATLGSYQFSTGKLIGIALDKGANSGEINTETVVPGTEGYHRATGTSYDAHTLGHFIALILPFPLVLSLSSEVRPMLRLGCIAASAAAILVLLMSMSRSAWVGSLVALAIFFMMIVAIWRERHLLPALTGVMVATAIVTPFVAPFIYDRFANSPFETLTTRFDQLAVAWRVFMLYPMFGVGPANWINVYPRYDYLWLPEDNSLSLVHNVVLWVAVEVGIFGLIPFICLLAVVMLRLLSLARQRRDIPGRLGLAALIGMITTEVTGLTDPAFREPNVFMMFWLLVALAVALPKMRPGAGAVLMGRPALPPCERRSTI